MGQYDAALFTALARSTERHLDKLSAQGLANVVWAYAKAGHLEDNMFAALKKSIEQRLEAFNSQDLANTAYAAVRLKHSSPLQLPRHEP